MFGQYNEEYLHYTSYVFRLQSVTDTSAAEQIRHANFWKTKFGEIRKPILELFN